jgi:hypothetical protein
MTQERQPLWRVMYHAYDQSNVPDELLESADAYDCLTDRYGYAAEIRALQRYILPDEPDLSAYERKDPIIAAQWRQRRRLRELLSAEAKRAEKGE